MSVAVFQVAVHLQQVELALVRGQGMSFHPEGNIRQTEDRQALVNILHTMFERKVP
jgi:hypothetical protein